MLKWNKSKFLFFFMLIIFVASICTVLSGPAFFAKRSTVDREESTTLIPITTTRASRTTTATAQATTKTTETTTTIYLQSTTATAQATTKTTETTTTFYLQSTTARKTTSETNISPEEECAECGGKYDNRCGDELLDPTPGQGCNLCGMSKCRFCHKDNEVKDEFLFCSEIP